MHSCITAAFLLRQRERLLMFKIEKNWSVGSIWFHSYHQLMLARFWLVSEFKEDTRQDCGNAIDVQVSHAMYTWCKRTLQSAVCRLIASDLRSSQCNPLVCTLTRVLMVLVAYAGTLHGSCMNCCTLPSSLRKASVALALPLSPALQVAVLRQQAEVHRHSESGAAPC